jgi:hypothetical protein
MDIVAAGLKRIPAPIQVGFAPGYDMDTSLSEVSFSQAGGRRAGFWLQDLTRLMELMLGV